ncbi:aldo/keto reductase [Streptomyces sp. NBC_01426]|uniref:aldo/keto reductase n=1 Tax=Streptomyces sp. NBC_01426 TaxID=2975866 RepID=UPI002E3346D0|nr:aldo/keto reductase [Streptomyces sp. NBC_01426]
MEGVEFAAAGGGCDLIDTADMYSRGQSEEMVGEALAARRDDVMLATKAALPMSEEHNHQGASRRWLAKALDDSLRRLGVDHIEMALDFVTAHPLVTSALIGPRTMEHLHSQLAAADTILPAEILDAIDAIVSPGVDLAPQEKNPTPAPAITDPSLRRRAS